MAHKVCRKCHKQANTTDFPKDRTRPSGRKDVCKECHTATARRWREENPDKYEKQLEDARRKKARRKPGPSYADKRALLDEYKRIRGCFFCGEREAVCLDFHHREPKHKSFTIGQHFHRSLDALFAEISKCEVVCANCHRKLHALLISF